MNNTRECIYEGIKAKLLVANLKATQQRIVIYHALMLLNNHPKAEQVYDLVRLDNPSISLGTVYKTLETFVESKLIKKVACEDGTMRFDGKTEAHNHILCTNTQEIIDFEDNELQSLIADFLSKKNIHNFKITDFQLQINGEKVNPDEQVKIS